MSPRLADGSHQGARMQGAAVRAIDAYLEVQRAAAKVLEEFERDEITRVGVGPLPSGTVVDEVSLESTRRQRRIVGR